MLQQATVGLGTRLKVSCSLILWAELSVGFAPLVLCQGRGKAWLPRLRRIPGLWTMNKFQREEREAKHPEVLDLLLALPLMSCVTLSKFQIRCGSPSLYLHNL